jgi:hypothetical protein
MPDISSKPKRPYRRRKLPAVEESTVVSAPSEPIPAASESVLTETPAPVASEPPTPAGPARTFLTAHELMQLRLAEADVKSATAEKETARIRRLYFLALLDPKGTILAEEKKMAKKDSELKSAKDKFALIRLRLGHKLKVDFNKVGIDPETGEIVLPPA